MNKATLRRVIFEEYDAQGLIKAREAKNLSLRAAAAAIGISYAHLCNAENGALSPSADFIEKLCAFYGIDPATIIKKTVSSAQTFA